MTLVELFDERQIENVIAGLRFRPEKIIYVGYKNTMTSRRKAAIESFFSMKGVKSKIEYEIVGRYDYGEIVEKLRSITDNNENCCFDATGGKELTLAAMGAVALEEELPVFQFDIRTSKLINVTGSDIPTIYPVALTVDEIITLNGGYVSSDGAEDIWIFDTEFRKETEKLWEICRKSCPNWNKQTIMLGTLEQFNETGDPLLLRTNLTRVEMARHEIYLNDRIIDDLISAGLIKDFYCENGILSFRYKNDRTRRTLTKAGNILELYTYLLLWEIRENDHSFYTDLNVGVYVDWDGDVHDENVYDTRNEIDIIAMRGVIPIFVSCKNGEVKKEALYELNTIAEHFGGNYSKKVLLTTYISQDSESRKYLLQRARDMKITVIENADKLTRDEFIQTLKRNVK